jgi:hypothetical protein
MRIGVSNLPDWVTPGASFREVYGNLNDSRWHVRGIVDGMAVCREWWPTKRRWHYEVKDATWFEVNAGNLYTPGGKKL